METATRTGGMQVSADIAALLKARTPLIVIVTREEARGERIAFDGCAAAQYVPEFWDCADGLTRFGGGTVDSTLRDPADALARFSKSTQRGVLVMRDLVPWLRNTEIVRSLRSIARDLPKAPRDQARAIILITPVSELPPELCDAVVIDLPLPDRAEIGGLLDGSISTLEQSLQADAAPNGTRDAAINSAVGLTEVEAKACFAKSLVSVRKIDPRMVGLEKKRVIEREKILEWFDPLPGGLDDVGGLENLKAWLQSRKAAFSPRARAYGLPAPKGILLVGVSGCGKTHTARAIATAFGMPLLRLDLGAQKSKYVGDSEKAIRKALKTVETVGQCVLMLDELDKAMAGASQGSADGGVSADSLGVVLQWMQDRTVPVFVCATANDVSGLPPELLRKGRFDEIFFVDLPNPTERAAILKTALRSHGRADIDVDLQSVAAETDAFTGAEIAALVPDSMFAAFADGEREITTADLVASAFGTVPLSRTAKEKIAAVRAWGNERARPASALMAKQEVVAGMLEI